jgi:hypothetical protein
MLSKEGVGSLVVMQERVVEGVLAHQLAGVGAAVAVGGVEGGTQKPLILIIDGPAPWPRSLPQAAAPYFAVSPDGREIAYWRQCPVEEAENVAELVAVDLWQNTSRSLSPPQVIGDGGSLVWPLPSNLVFAAIRPMPSGNWGMVWRLDVGSGRTFCLLERPAGTTVGKLHLVAGGKEEVAYADPLGALLVPVTGADPIPTQLEPVLWRRPGDESWLVLTPRVELRTPAGTRSFVELRANTAAWAPGGTAALLAAKGKLYVAPADLSFARELVGWQSEPQEFVHLLWRPNVVEGVAATLWPKPAIHLFALGTEYITATIVFPAKTIPAIGARVWVARDFQLAATGTPVEPIWPTLKACFSVVKAKATEGGVVVEAENVGTQPGVLERVCRDVRARTNVSEIATVVEGRRIVWVERYDAEPRTDLRAWIDGVPALGGLHTLHVERRRLDAP